MLSFEKNDRNTIWFISELLKKWPSPIYGRQAVSWTLTIEYVEIDW